MGLKYLDKTLSPSPKRGKISTTKGEGGDVYTNFS